MTNSRDKGAGGERFANYLKMQAIQQVEVGNITEGTMLLMLYAKR